MKELVQKNICQYKEKLINEEKSTSTINKYLHDINEFYRWLENKELCKDTVIKYKAHLCEKYAITSVNTVLASINSFFAFIERYDLKVKNLKIQKQIFSSTDTELTKLEYERLLNVAKQKKNERLYLLMQTICSTGIRVSELRYITVEAISCGSAEIKCKGKCRRVLLTKRLCQVLKKYAQENKIKSGAVFITKNGNPLDRSNIWNDMKKLCKDANVPDKKVFPHNLRHLFARTYYTLQKDVVRLADILGHSSVNTTRIYTMETGEMHRKQIQQLGLLRL